MLKGTGGARATLVLLFPVLLALGTVACGHASSRIARTGMVPSATVAGVPPSSLDAGAFARGFDGAAAWQTVKTLADPSFEGRHLGTPGEREGADYIAARFAEAGLEPAGDAGTYLQSFPVTVEEMAATPTLTLTGAGGSSQSLRLRDDFRPIFGGLAGAGDVEGAGIFVGPDADLQAAGVAGKVVYASGRGSLHDLVLRARDAGALAVIVPTGEATILKAEGSPPDAGAIPVAEVSQSGSAALLEGSGHTREELNADAQAGRPLPTFPLAWTIGYRVSLRPPATVQGQNVVGVLRGRPGAAAVLVGAHYEEIGPDPDGAVFPAANDNASGVSVLLELVRLLHAQAARPEVTLVFVSWSGHEEGLYGSRFYVDHPPVPLARTKLYLNLDTVGQGSGSSVDAFASDSSAQELLRRADAALKAAALDAPIRPLDRRAGASDDITLARAGVPSLALSWTGIGGTLIHTPQDTADQVDPAKLRVTGQVAAAVLAEANAEAAATH